MTQPRFSSIDSKRVNLSTMVGRETYVGLEKIAKREGLNGKGRAIDWLIEAEIKRIIDRIDRNNAGATKAGVA